MKVADPNGTSPKKTKKGTTMCKPMPMKCKPMPMKAMKQSMKAKKKPIKAMKTKRVKRGTRQEAHALEGNEDLPNRSPTPKEYYDFKHALNASNKACIREMVQDVKRLPAYMGKERQMQDMVLAYSMGGFQHALFKRIEEVHQVKKVFHEEQAVPMCIMIGMCGGKDGFKEGLRQGDIEQVTHPEDETKSLYRFRAYKESQGINHNKKVSFQGSAGCNKKEGHAALTMLNQLNFQWIMPRKDIKAIAAGGGMDSSDEEGDPMPNGGDMPKAWKKCEEAYKAVPYMIMSVKKVMGNMGSSTIATTVQEDLRKHLSMLEPMKKNLEHMAMNSSMPPDVTTKPATCKRVTDYLSKVLTTMEGCKEATQRLQREKEREREREAGGQRERERQGGRERERGRGGEEREREREREREGERGRGAERERERDKRET